MRVPRLERFPATLLLMPSQYTLAAVVGILLGVLSARRPGSGVDTSLTFLSLASFSIPIFWLGQMLLLVFAYNLSWFPVQGMMDLREGYTGWRLWLDIAHHLVLPVTTLTIFNMGLILRLTRSSMIQGLSERVVLLRHALRNALLERGHRLLEDHGDAVAADAAHLAFARPHRIDAPERDATSRDVAGAGDEAHDRVGGDALAGAGYAHQADDLAAADGQIDTANRPDLALLRPKARMQTLDPQDVVRQAVHRQHAAPAAV